MKQPSAAFVGVSVIVLVFSLTALNVWIGFIATFAIVTAILYPRGK